MPELTSREMGYTSHEVKRIHREVILHKNQNYAPNCIACPKCKGKGFLHDKIKDKIENCERCNGYGFTRKT